MGHKAPFPHLCSVPQQGLQLFNTEPHPHFPPTIRMSDKKFRNRTEDVGPGRGRQSSTSDCTMWRQQGHVSLDMEGRETLPAPKLLGSNENMDMQEPVKYDELSRQSPCPWLRRRPQEAGRGGGAQQGENTGSESWDHHLQCWDLAGQQPLSISRQLKILNMPNTRRQ